MLWNNTLLAPLWLVLRVYVGWQWIEAGWGKFSNPAWVGDNSGAALHGFIMSALQKTTGAHPEVQSWYASFLQNFVDQHTVLFSYLVTFGELAVGAALILGLFTGVAAFFGGFMNMQFLLAGSVSINPVLLLLQLPLMLAWRVAGLIGLDRFILPKFLGKEPDDETMD